MDVRGNAKRVGEPSSASQTIDVRGNAERVGEPSSASQTIDVVRLVVITDRRLYPSEEMAGHVARILAGVPRGSVLIQVREKDLDGGPLLRLVREIIEVAHPAGAPVWVNDRVDVALAARADGVHLPERGLAVADARAAMVAASASVRRTTASAPPAVVAPRSLTIGCSRHDPEATLAAAQAGADLVQLGPIWSTPGKGEPIGLPALHIRNKLPRTTRLVAVGGIATPERARAAAAAGADAIAVIRAAWTTSDPGSSLAELIEAVDAGRTRR